MKTNNYRRRIGWQILLVFCSGMVPAFSFAEVSLSMSDFDHGAELTPRDTALRRLPLSPQMISQMKQRDLGDVRVFDYNNQLMPLSIRDLNENISELQQSLQVTPYKVSGRVQGFVLRRPETASRWLKSLQLFWKNQRAPSVLIFKIEHSADGKNWSALKSSAVVSNFRFDGESLNHNIIDVNANAKQHIRLLFAAKPRRSPVLTAVTATLASAEPVATTWITTGQLEPVENEARAYRFSTSEAITPRQIRLNIRQLNTRITGTLYAQLKRDGKTVWQPAIKNLRAYNVTLNNKIVRSRSLDLPDIHAHEWKLVLKKGSELDDSDLPDVMVSYPVLQLVFAAEGDEVYTVVWGSSQASAAQLTTFEQADLAETVYQRMLMDKQVLTETVQTRLWIFRAKMVGYALLFLIGAYSLFRLYQKKSQHLGQSNN